MVQICNVSHSFLLSFSAQTESPQSLYKHDSPEDGNMELNLVYSDVQLNTTTQCRYSIIAILGHEFHRYTTKYQNQLR